VAEPAEVAQIGHAELLRETGSEGIECIMWLIMRGALDEHVKVVHRFYHVPASNTAYGLLVLENK
jgi:protocatechuate 4,5-dioxygenase beta chain